MAFIVKSYDLLIKNGTVVDPGRGIHGKRDIGIYGSRIVDVYEPGTKPGKLCGMKVIDASGMTVIPGLVDGHVHVLPGMLGRFTYPVDEMWKRGITAVIDMGSNSYCNFNSARAYLDAIPCRTNVYLNLSTMGAVQGEIPRYVLLEQEVNFEKTKEIFDAHGDVVVGIKALIGHNDSPGAELTHKVLKKARDLCDYLGCRMAVHVASPDIPFHEVISYFKPGDNFTHTYNKGNILDEQGSVYPEAFEAQKRGVLFDSARGSRNWSVEVARKAFEQGFYPDIITDDLTNLSNDPYTSRLHVHMGECMALGMSFEDVVYRTTYAPAQQMNQMQVGIACGLPANITILDVQKGPHEFVDAFGVHYMGNTNIVPMSTIVNGKIMYNRIESDY